MSDIYDEYGGEQPLQEQATPWYRNPTNPLPFKLFKKISSKNPNAPTLRTIAMFSWTLDSLKALWDGAFYTEECLPEWTKTIEVFGDAVAIGSNNMLYIFFAHGKRRPICVRLPPDPTVTRPIPIDTMQVAWALQNHLRPLVLFSRHRILYIVDPTREDSVSHLFGHGGTITSIAAHPNNPHLFCTTSRDYSTRIYDLKLRPQQVPNNPHWPPLNVPSLAGPAHGLHMNVPEGQPEGIGRCVIVLMGGRSGGHMAAVLGAAFHPKLPVIATCGLDRAIKIWVVRQKSDDQIKREDKPLFSSSRIHKARVLSVTWLKDDLLLSHCAPAYMREHPDDPDCPDLYTAPGELVMWHWLGIDRFFPPGFESHDLEVIHGSLSDYQESSSFKIITTNSFKETESQLHAAHVHVFQSATHDPVLLITYPGETSTLILNASHLPPRRPKPFPFKKELEAHSAARSGDSATELSIATADIALEDDEDDGVTEELKAIMEKSKRETDYAPPIEGRHVGIDEQDEEKQIRLERCVMGLEGRIIVGVGTKGTVLMWKLG